MRVRNHGKYTKMSQSNPRAIGRCDYSGLMTRHSDLVRQKEYRGTGLVWTGYWVNPKFVDEPNPQNLTPLIKLDPIPVKNPRPDNVLVSGSITIDVSGHHNVTLTYQQFDNTSITFIGNLTNDIIVYVPNTFNQFSANNLTTGVGILSMQIEGLTTPALLIPPADEKTKQGPQIANTVNALKIIYF